MKYGAFFLALCAAYISPAHATADSVTLTYRAQNHWIHQDDLAPLNTLTAKARTAGASKFVFKLPPDADADLYVERLVVLRNILDQRLKTQVTLTQVEGAAPANTIVMDVQK